MFSLIFLVHVTQKSHVRHGHHFVSITVVNSEGGVGKLLTFQYVSQNLAQLEPNLIEGLLWYSSTNLIEGLL
jgi:hypothetical protein